MIVLKKPVYIRGLRRDTQLVPLLAPPLCDCMACSLQLQFARSGRLSDLQRVHGLIGTILSFTISFRTNAGQTTHIHTWIADERFLTVSLCSRLGCVLPAYDRYYEGELAGYTRADRRGDQSFRVIQPSYCNR
jgi:hypothetical protein